MTIKLPIWQIALRNLSCLLYTSPKNQGCARVYWFEDMSALSAADFPADMGEDFKFPMVKIKLDAKISYPSWQDFSEMFPDEKDDDAFNDACLLYTSRCV